MAELKLGSTIAGYKIIHEGILDSITRDIVPYQHDSLSLGEADKQWLYAYITTIYSSKINTNDLNVSNNLTIDNQIISNVQEGIPPLVVQSKTLVANLNTDLLDGKDGAYYTNQSNLDRGTVPVERLQGLYNIDISGNAQTQSKLETARTIALSGDVTGSATFDGSQDIDINISVKDDSHSHSDQTITSVDWSKLLNIPSPTITLDGDVSGSVTLTNLSDATLTVTVLDDSHIHDSRYYTKTETDNKFVFKSGDTINGDITINGNFRVSGTSVTIDAESVKIADNKITINSNVDSGVPTENAGIEISRGSEPAVSLIWDEAGNAWYVTEDGITFNRLYHTNYHPKADRLTTPRKIQLDGDVTGDALFDGSSDIAITATVVDNSHNHDDSTITSVDWSKLLNIPSPKITLDGAINGSAVMNDLGDVTIVATVANDSHTHDLRYYTKEESDDKFVFKSGDTISGDLVIQGNLTVSGTTTFVNTETVQIADNIIMLNSNFTSGTPTENAGIEISRGSESIVRLIWDETDDCWKVTESGTDYYRLYHDNYHPLADRLSSERVISITGSASGSQSFDGSSDISIDVSIADDSHKHSDQTITSVDWSKLLNVPSPTITLTGDVSGTGSMSQLGNVTISVSVQDDSHSHSKSTITDLLNTDFVPESNGQHDIGSGTNKWKDIYFSGSLIGDNWQVKKLFVDVSQNKPQPGEKGRLFIETDTNSMFYDDGAQWISVGKTTIFISDLEDVEPKNPTNGQILKYDGTKWVNSQVNWSELVNIPSEFNPQPHSHIIDDLQINNSIIPNSNGTYDIGSNQNKWQDIYFAGKLIGDNWHITQVIVDIQDNLPAAGSIGRLFIAKDTGSMYYDDGTTWINIGASLDGQSGNADKLDGYDATAFVKKSGDIINGDLTVKGTLTIGPSSGTQSIEIPDTFITLNGNFTTGTPSEDAGIKVLRGQEPTVQFKWDETHDSWTITEDGSTYKKIYHDQYHPHADDADKLDGKHASDFVLKSGDTINGNLTLSGGSLYLPSSGFSGAGQIQSTGTVKIANGSSAQELYVKQISVTDSWGDADYNKVTNGIYTKGGIKTKGVITSLVADGTAPFSVSSTTKVTNLHADLLDGYHGSDFILKTGGTITGNLTVEGLLKGILTGHPLKSYSYDGTLHKYWTKVGQFQSASEAHLAILVIGKHDLNYPHNLATIVHFSKFSGGISYSASVVQFGNVGGVSQEIKATIDENGGLWVYNPVYWSSDIQFYVLQKYNVDVYTDASIYQEAQPTSWVADPRNSIKLARQPDGSYIVANTYKPYYNFPDGVKIEGNTVWHAGNDGSGSGLDADLLDGKHAGNASGNIPINNGTLNTNLNADLLDGKHASDFANATHTHVKSDITDFAHTHTASDITNLSSASVGYATTSGNADTVDGKHASDFATASHNHDSAYVKLSGSQMTGTLTVPLLQIDNSYTKLDKGYNNSLRIQTNSGYVDIGPQNTSYAHIYTDRPQFYFNKDIKGQGKVWGAVYNDYQEYRLQKEEIEPGYVAVTDTDGRVKKCNKDRQRNIAGVVSDVFGFAIGKVKGEISVPIQVAGRVLIYQKDKHKLKQGDQVCSTKDGRVRKMKWWEKILFPEQIVGYVDEIPTYKEWGNDKVKVNGRIWVRLR